MCLYSIKGKRNGGIDYEYNNDVSWNGNFGSTSL